MSNPYVPQGLYSSLAGQGANALQSAVGNISGQLNSQQPGGGQGGPMTPYYGTTVQGPLGSITTGQSNPGAQNAYGPYGSMSTPTAINQYIESIPVNGSQALETAASGGIPVTGLYGSTATPGDVMQSAASKWSLSNDANMQNSNLLGTIAQQYGAAGQNALNASAPGIQQGLGAQQTAAGTSGYQTAGLNALQQTAQGNGPNVAGMQSQQAVSQALQAQLAGAASAKGGAYAQAGAQRQAALNSASIQGQAAGTAASTAAQQQLGAQSALASSANQAQSVAGQNAANLTSSQLANESANLGYDTGQQSQYQAQQQLAENAGIAQLNANYGLSGTQLQTQTQQNIANQQQTMTGIGAGIGGASLVAALLSTGAAEAGARGARDAGLSKEHAAKIGAMIGQHVGAERLGGKVPEAAAKADTEAAAKAAQGKPRGMSHDDMRGHLANLRKRIPASAQYEPAAPHAYQAGSALARLAKLRGAA